MKRYIKPLTTLHSVTIEGQLLSDSGDGQVTEIFAKSNDLWNCAEDDARKGGIEIKDPWDGE